MNIVFIIPTGVGAEIGGHAGDATPAARLIGSVCDRIILHPNVVNAADINEMPSNSLYVDGYMLNRFLSGDIGLKPVRSNKVLVAINPRENNADAINAVAACRATLGIDAEIIILNERLILRSSFDKSGAASGEVFGTDALIGQVFDLDFDALAVITEIETPDKVALNYFKNGGVNPWGAVEAMACYPISEALSRPVAHAPIDSGVFNKLKIITDPRIAAEMVSTAFLFCVIKGLHTAPRWVSRTLFGHSTVKGGKDSLYVEDVDLLVSPDMKFGTPHHLCLKHNVPILVVEENTTVLPPADGDCVRVANYLEAAGWIASMRVGINPKAVRRPLDFTCITVN